VAANGRLNAGQSTSFGFNGTWNSTNAPSRHSVNARRSGFSLGSGVHLHQCRIEQLNATVDAWDGADEARRIGSRAHTVGELFAIEQPLLAPLPDEPFETGIWLGPRVDPGGRF
jgi:hypothetical protein